MKNVSNQHINWLNVRGYLSKAFFWSGIGVPIVLGLILAIYSGQQNIWAREALRYKELVFLSASGKSYSDIEIKDVDLEKDFSWSMQVGGYFLSEYKKGVSSEKILAEYWSNRKKLERFNKDDNKRPALLAALSARGLPGPIASMLEDWRWQKMTDNEEDMKTLTAILKGEKQPPVLEYQSLRFPWRIMWVWGLLLTQFISYFACMCKCGNDWNRMSLNQALNLGRFHTYVVLILFSPGAWLLLAINPVAVRFIYWVDAKLDLWESNKKREANRVAELVPEMSSYSDQELAKKLRQRLGTREET